MDRANELGTSLAKVPEAR